MIAHKKIFSSNFDGVSPNDPYEKFKNSDTSFEDNKNKIITYHITMSSILLCPHLLKGPFDHLLHVNML